MKHSFLKRIAKFIKLNNQGCWLWQGALTEKGYGRCWYKGRCRRAHIALYEEMFGPVPEGYELDHLCRNRNCINLRHLEPVKHKINVGRGLSGSFQTAKTHCPQGHEYNETNTRIYKGSRHCRICAYDKTKSWRINQSNSIAV